MAKINDSSSPMQWFGPKSNTKQIQLAIPAGPSGDEPGLLYLESSSSAAVKGGIFVWADSNNLFRYSATKPTDEDADGTALDSTTIGAAANKALSNLASVAIAVDLDPAATNTYDLGDSTHVYAESFVTKSVFYPTNSYITGTSAVATLTGALVCGADGTGSDVTLYGATSGSFAKWTKTTTGVFGLTDDAIVAFGDADDFTMKFNASSMLLDNKTANTGNLLIGSAVDTDVTLESQSAAGKDIHWDASAYTLRILDSVLLGFGTGGSTDSDINFIYDGGTNILNIGQTVNTTGSITIGADDEGMDVTFFAETSGDYLKWDENGASNLGALIFEDSVLQFAGAAITHTIGISTDILAFTATDSSEASITFGTTGTTNGTDIVFNTKTANDHITFDAGSKTLTFRDVGAVFGYDDNTVLYTLQALTGDALTLDCTDTSAGKLVLGTTGTNGLDVDFIGASSGDHVKFVSTGTWTYTDVPVTCTGADQSGTLLTLTGIDTTGNSDTMVIDHAGTGYALYIDLNGATSDGIKVSPHTNATVPALEVDGDEHGFLGAANVGMVLLRNDIALADVASSVLLIENGATKPINAAEGYCLRIADTAVVASSPPAYAMYIDCTANEGLGIETRAAAAKNLVLLGVAGQTDSMLYIDGQTGAGWEGAANVGQLHIVNDAAFDDQGSALYIDLAEAPTAASEGAGIHVIQSAGSACTDGYLVNIEAVATGGGLHVDGGYSTFDEKVTFIGGQQSTPVSLTAETTPGAGNSTIAAGVNNISVTSTHTDDVLVLPTAVLGDVIMLKATATTDFELQAPAATVSINGTACTGTPPKEILITAEDVTFAICTKAGSSGTWVTFSVTDGGVVTNGVTPD